LRVVGKGSSPSTATPLETSSASFFPDGIQFNLRWMFFSRQIEFTRLMEALRRGFDDHPFA
jgi:hypothetical protein